MSRLWASAFLAAGLLAACSGEAPPANTAVQEEVPAPVANAAVALPATEPVAETPPPAAAATPPSAAPAPIHRRDAGRERRIAMLVENAMERDPAGMALEEADRAEAERARCGTQACVDRSYARQEASLRSWEGSEAIR